jgi:hypothetical protein
MLVGGAYLLRPLLRRNIAAHTDAKADTALPRGSRR